MMKNQAHQHLINELNHQALSWDSKQLDSLMQSIGDAKIVLIGEASHGTKEFYQTRIDITKKLIEKKGFNLIAIEGDWPDTYPIHRYLNGQGEISDARNALSAFKRFPQWMWRNKTIPPFLEWLRQHNDQLNALEKIGFYGLDLYSLNRSMHAVINYLTKTDPELASIAKERYACFDHLYQDPQSYGYLTTSGIKKPCTKQVIEQFMALQYQMLECVKKDGLEKLDEYFYAVQNAHVVKNAEQYYRLMFESNVSSWNARDSHMHETCNMLIEHLENHHKTQAKMIIWAHNSHIGDARATEMSERGEHNIGQLIREQYGNDSYHIGFSTFEGSVTAANNWDELPQVKIVNPGIPESYEDLFHQLNHDNFLLNLRHSAQLEHYLKIPRLQRAIGVIYRPETERISHYFLTRLPYQFDSIIHFDKTTALEPLDI